MILEFEPLHGGGGGIPTPVGGSVECLVCEIGCYLLCGLTCSGICLIWTPLGPLLRYIIAVWLHHCSLSYMPSF